MGKFSLDISAFVKKAKGSADAVVRKVVLDVGARIVERSPVGDGSLWKNPPPKGYIGGRFRANWQASEGTSPSGDLPDIDPTGSASNERIAAAIPINAAGGKYFLANNLPYAERLETGWSKQAPAGMVGLVVEEFTSIVDDAVQAVKQ